ncbi:uncharacterized protein isoform X2 [Takifugu rubripes]|uniref:uncharacterized protein isoform X2 n=1 Tax=Takifugu rubripes TaxID=31033 RepID=UPI0011453B0C|nr:uncharacterized protein LOC105417210 isoform X2 [Takifugu rubripes]XP_029701126.1 uncharacterized protein LOC115251761 isoform X2 [Takifugu rubripes]
MEFDMELNSEMFWGAASSAGLCLHSFLLLGVCFPAGAAEAPPLLTPEDQSGESGLEDLEWGSGSSFLHLLHSFPADSPFRTETPGEPVNCSQQFWLPPSSDICWEDIAGPEEFAKSRLLVLQNRAALQAVSASSGVEDGAVPYEHQAREEVQGIQSDHQGAVETIETMEKVFVSLEEKRKQGKEEGLLTSMKENLFSTRSDMDRREHMANILENHFTVLENTLVNMQLRLSRLIHQ